MKLTRSQKRIYERAKMEPILIDSEGFRWTNGAVVHKRVFNNLIEKGLLKPNNDGLFTGFSQTWSAQ
jgi:hypothetical protein